MGVLTCHSSLVCVVTVRLVILNKFENKLYLALPCHALLYVWHIGRAVVYLRGSMAKVEVTLEIPSTEFTSFL